MHPAACVPIGSTEKSKVALFEDGIRFELVKWSTRGWARTQGVRMLAEKVVHHPTIIAGHCQGRGWSLDADSDVRSKFWGRSIELTPVGTIPPPFSPQPMSSPASLIPACPLPPPLRSARGHAIAKPPLHSYHIIVVASTHHIRRTIWWQPLRIAVLLCFRRHSQTAWMHLSCGISPSKCSFDQIGASSRSQSEGGRSLL